MECKEKGESKTILFNLCGHGHFDMAAYDDYFNGRLADDVFEEELVNKALSNLPEVS
jgi:tryptophan synthase beta chain